jgi:undecaprenyl-diphosphatase
LNQTVAGITFFGSPIGITLVTVTAFMTLWWLAKDRVGAAKIATAAAGAGLWIEVIKRLFERPRPTIVPHLAEFTGFSYPSGHALAATATFGMLAMIASSHVREAQGRVAIHFVCWALAGLVAISRVYLGVHYPTDVIGGVVLGSAWIYLTAYFWSNRAASRSH